MDPEVSSPVPAACPKCGMALEAETITLDEKPDPEMTNMTRRFGVALVLAAPLFLYGMPTALHTILPLLHVETPVLHSPTLLPQTTPTPGMAGSPGLGGSSTRRGSGARGL
jgi:Cu+-exporting ATPase